MAEPQRHIEHLHVRVPGADADAGTRISADLTRALAATIPLSRSRAPEVAALRAWASHFARPA